MLSIKYTELLSPGSAASIWLQAAMSMIEGNSNTNVPEAEAVLLLNPFLSFFPSAALFLPAVSFFTAPALPVISLVLAETAGS